MSSILQNISGPLSGQPSSKNPPHEAKRQLGWIKYCIKNHRSCNELPEEPFLPTRLIDVRSFPSIRLIDTHHLEAKDKRFIALSYCWGSSMPAEAKTVLSSLEANQKRINLKPLPKTIRDAVEVTKYLGIPFIWIDALCIIQDSRPDWEYELETMLKVYSYATFTIAAGVSDHCDGGFLHPRRLLSHLRTRSVLPNPTSTSTDETWIGKFFKTPLFSRGWTLQERELSPRVIHFTSNAVIFECRIHIRRYSVTTAHQYAFTMPLELENKYLLEPDAWRYRCFDKETQRQRFVAVSDLPNGMNWHKVWHRLVGEFSSRKFTNQNDKLPAIAGLANQLQSWFNWKYMAGLWEDNLALDLLWQGDFHKDTDFVEGVGTIEREYVAPSWAWPSADFSIRYNDPELGSFGKSVITVLETHLVPAGSNENGKLASGFLKISTRVKPLQGMLVESWMPQEKLLRVYKQASTLNDVQDKLWVYWDRQSDLDAEEEVLIALVMFRETGSSNGAGLALRRTDEGHYRRVGMAVYISRAFIEGVEPIELVLV